MNSSYRLRSPATILGLATGIAFTWACSSSATNAEPRSLDGGDAPDAREDASGREQRDSSKEAEGDAPPVDDSPATQISAGILYTCAAQAAGGVRCWGYNFFGNLGNGTTLRDGFGGVPIPTPVTGLTDAIDVSASWGDHTCARRSSGEVLCWGRNVNAQLGDGSKTDRLVPVMIAGLTDAVQISLGHTHSCARRASGVVVCWGDNVDGRLGDGTTTDRRTPTLVPGLTDIQEIAAGASHTCARRTSGEVLCWGDNTNGQLGDGTTTGRQTPTLIGLPNDVEEISAGASHTCARRTSGEVLCWGNNTNGQLGDGTFASHLTPTLVDELDNVEELSAGSVSTCARQSSGAVLCWGYPPLGDGTLEVRSTPTAVTGLTDAVEISIGGSHKCARRASGDVVCWGDGLNGQLGNGKIGNNTNLTPEPILWTP